MSDQPFQPLLAADTVAVPISAPISETQLYQRHLYAFLEAADLKKYYQVLSENDLTVQLLKSWWAPIKSLWFAFPTIVMDALYPYPFKLSLIVEIGLL